MTCEELVSYLSDYIDGNLTEELHTDAQEHLATCNNFHVVLDTTQQMIVLLRQSGPRSIPIDRRQALFQKLNATFELRRARKLSGST